MKSIFTLVLLLFIIASTNAQSIVTYEEQSNDEFVWTQQTTDWNVEQVKGYIYRGDSTLTGEFLVSFNYPSKDFGNLVQKVYSSTGYNTPLPAIYVTVFFIQNNMVKIIDYPDYDKYRKLLDYVSNIVHIDVQ